MWSDEPRRIRLRLPGFIVAVLALISQLALGAIVLPDHTPTDGAAALAAAMVDCAPGTTPPARPDTPGHHNDGAALCPLSVALALPSVILSPAPALPTPPLVLAVRTDRLPPARAPPSRVPDAAYPRGPPALS